MKDGLNNNTIYDIFHENKGFVWLATDMGISRHDGFRIRNFPLTSYSNERSGIPVSCAVTSITKGGDGLFYLLLLRGGLICFDPNKEKYVTVHFDKPLNDLNILSFYLSDKQILYLGTTDGLYTGKVVRSRENEEEAIHIHLSNEPLVKGEISELARMGQERIFACVDRTKILVYDLDDSKSEYLYRKEDDRITKLYQHGDYLWICSVSSGIELYNLRNKTWHKIEVAEQYKDFLSGTSITDIVYTGNRHYFLATCNGLLSMNFESEELGKATCSFGCPGQPFPFRTERKITNLLWNEEQQMLWVATFGDGLYKMCGMEKDFYSLEQKFDTEIVGIEEDQQGYVWLLTKKGKLWRSDSNQFSIKTKFQSWTKGLKPGERYWMYEHKKGCLWLGGSHGEIVCINPSTGVVTTFRLPVKEKPGLSEAIRRFCLDSRNRLWIATTNHLVLFDYKKRESLSVPLEYEGQKIREIYSMAEDKEGNIWLGTDMGLKYMDNQDSLIQVHGNYEQDAGFQVSPVYLVYVNSSNRILASYSDKILCIDGREKEKVEKVFTLLNGLNSTHIYCMIDDKNGNTWLGSNSGVMTIRNDEDLLYNYASLGYSGAVCRLHDGRLLWASSLGLTLFDPETVKMERHKSTLCLSEVRVNGEFVPVGKSLNGKIVLTTTPSRQSDFVLRAGNDYYTFYFSDLQYGIMQCKQAYRLLPDEDWKIGRLEDGITFKNLPVGNYTLQVKLLYHDADESDTIEIPISIAPYWWDTIWARIGYLLIALGMIYSVYSYLGHRGRKLEVRRDREIELWEKLNLAKMKQAQKQEIDTMRNQLLTRFMRELRTPLSLIIAPLKEMSQERALPVGVLSNLGVAYRNSLGMLDSCNQLLAIYTQGFLTDSLKVAPYTIGQLVDKVLFSISELVRMNQIDFKCDKRIKKDLEVWVDNKRMNFVLHNLLTNAFNHIRFSGVVRLSLQEIVRDEVRYCVITVEDNGKNEVTIAENALQLDLSGVELGYDVMEKIIQLHHGTLLMKSSAGEGTEVVMELPVGRELLQADPNIVFVDPELQDDVVETSSSVEEKSPEVPVPEETVTRIASGSEPIRRERKKLLIVEDHKDIRLYLKVLFGKEYDLLIATNGQEGVDLAVKELPDLILCDVMMPVKDGFECCREVKENPDTCNIPFIMLTAKVDDDDVIHGLELGADDYVLKPFTPGILKAKVRNQINGRIQLKQMYTKLLMPSGDGNPDAPGNIGKKVKVEDPFITSVVKIIEENICEADFNVKKLASELHMSQPTLYRKVKQSTDFTIIELIRGVRMRKAAELLKQKIYAVQEVAEKVGYNDIPTFRKHFVDAFGTTPSTYPNPENS